VTVAVVREPLYRTAPDCRRSYGDLARRLAVDLGWVPDDEQQFLLDRIFDERAPGIPTSPEVCIIGPRQNLKTATLEVASLTDLCVLGLEALWTAHLTSTSSKSFQDMQGRLRANDQYAGLVDFKQGRGEELIVMRDSGVTLEFRARHGGGGRGFTVPRVTLDEALYLRPSDIGSLGPTMVTRRDMQVRYASSAGLTSSAVLRGLRQRGRAGSDSGLTYVEYGAPRRDCEGPDCRHFPDTPGCALDDRELWWQANCALWAGRITEESLERQRKLMSSEPGEFAREFLTWWDDPPEGGGVLDLALWDTLTVGNQTPVAPVLSVEVALERSRTTIGSAWKVDDRPHVEVFEERAGVEWVAARVAELVDKYDVPSVVVDGNTEAASLVPALEQAGVKVLTVKGADRAAACAGFYDLASTSALSHNGDPALSQALASARWKDVGEGARAFSRRRSAGDIAALYAVTLALLGLASAPDYDPLDSFY